MPWFTLLTSCAGSGGTPEPTTPHDAEPHSSVQAAPPQAAQPTAHNEASKAAATQETEENEPETPVALPTACAEGYDLCVPSPAFVNRLCKGKFPSVAVVMFEKNSPWTRVYVRQVEIDAVNTQGGPASDQKLVFGEEVILLLDTNANAQGIRVSGSGYFVLRWDGTCSTVGAEEVVNYAPGMVQNAPVVWRYLEAPLRDALLEKPNVRNAYSQQREHCRGARPGQGSSACAKARRLLNTHLTLAVRGGMELPPLQRLP